MSTICNEEESVHSWNMKHVLTRCSCTSKSFCWLVFFEIDAQIWNKFNGSIFFLEFAKKSIFGSNNLPFAFLSNPLENQIITAHLQIQSSMWIKFTVSWIMNASESQLIRNSHYFARKILFLFLFSLNFPYESFDPLKNEWAPLSWFT